MNFDLCQGDGHVMAYEYADAGLYEVAPFACGSAHQVSSHTSDAAGVIHTLSSRLLGRGVPP